MPERCETCRFYDAPPAVPDSAFVPEFARVPGLCRFLPAAVSKMRDSWCGQHRPVEQA